MAELDTSGSDQRRAGVRRYSGVAILFHWTIAALILWQIAIGNWMADALWSKDEAVLYEAYRQVQLHKSIGLLILALSVLRLVWRWSRPRPALPPGMPAYERAIAWLTHMAAYGLMIGLPLIGMVAVASSKEFSSVPTTFFGLFEVPHLPLPGGLEGEAMERAHRLASRAHAWLAYGFAALLILHIAAALKHHFLDRDQVLARMVPGLAPRAPVSEPPLLSASRLETIGAGALLLAFGLGAGALFAFGPSPQQAGAGDSHAAMEAGDVSKWVVAAEDSSIVAVGDNAGQEFRVVFERWTAEIAFDPDLLEASKARVIVQAESGVSGVMEYDGVMPTADWFDVANHPEIVFEASSFRRQGEAYEVDGDLTIKGVTKPVTFPFELSIDGDRAEMTASLMVKRSDFGLGAAADASGMIALSPEVRLELRVAATRDSTES